MPLTWQARGSGIPWICVLRVKWHLVFCISKAVRQQLITALLGSQGSCQTPFSLEGEGGISERLLAKAVDNQRSICLCVLRVLLQNSVFCYIESLIYWAILAFCVRIIRWLTHLHLVYFFPYDLWTRSNIYLSRLLQSNCLIAWKKRSHLRCFCESHMNEEKKCEDKTIVFSSWCLNWLCPFLKEIRSGMNSVSQCHHCAVMCQGHDWHLLALGWRV